MDNFYAGISAGILSTIICNPFDIIRINIQSNYKLNTLTFIKTKYTKYGLRYFYKGLGIGLLTIPSFWGIYFPLYEYNKNKISSPIAGYISGCISSTLTCPLWVIRQKIQTDNKFSIIKYYKNNNINIFYTGLFPTYLINLSFCIQMPIYEYLKNKYKNTTINIFLMTSFSKTIGSLCMYPFDTLRVLSRKNPNESFKNIIFNLNKNPILYYRGLPNYIIRSIPYHTATFCTFEYYKKYSRKRKI